MKKNTMIKATIGILIITSISKLTGFFREVMIAYRFGSDFTTDAYFVSNSIYAVIFGLAGAGLSAAIIPILSRIRNEKKTTEGEYINNMAVLFTLVSFIVISIAYIFAKPLVKIFAVGFTGEELSITTRYLRIGLPIIYCNFMYSIFEAFNHSRNRFFLVASGGMLVNAVVVSYLAIFYDRFGMEGLIVSNILAYGLRALLIYLPLSKDTGKKLSLKIKDEYLKATYSIMFPLMISAIIMQINLIVDRTLASTLVEGSISALRYAAQTRYAINGLFITAMVTVIYPSFSEWIVKDDKEKLKKMFTYSMNMITILVIPLTAGLTTLNHEIVDVIYSRGAFNAEAVYMTSSALFYYSLGIAATGMGLFINKVYYAYQDSKTTMKIGMAAVVLNIILNLILVRYMAHNGLALATSIVATLSVIVKIYLLKNKNLEIEYKNILSIMVKSIIASVPMALVVKSMSSLLYITSGTSIIKVIKLISTVGAGAIVYFVLIYFLYLRNTNMMKTLQEKIRKRIKI